MCKFSPFNHVNKYYLLILVIFVKCRGKKRVPIEEKKIKKGEKMFNPNPPFPPPPHFLESF